MMSRESDVCRIPLRPRKPRPSLSLRGVLLDNVHPPVPYTLDSTAATR